MTPPLLQQKGEKKEKDTVQINIKYNKVTLNNKTRKKKLSKNKKERRKSWVPSGKKLPTLQGETNTTKVKQRGGDQ